METVFKDKIFGNVAAHVTIIEFQKRRFPHAYCIFILYQILEECIAKSVASGWSNLREAATRRDGEIRELMFQDIIRNPFRSHNPAAVCMGDRGCKKNFSKPFWSGKQQL